MVRYTGVCSKILREIQTLGLVFTNEVQKTGTIWSLLNTSMYTKM